MNYKITLFVEGYVDIDGKYQRVELSKKGECRSMEDVYTFVGIYTEIFGDCRFKIETIEEEA